MKIALNSNWFLIKLIEIIEYNYLNIKLLINLIISFNIESYKHKKYLI